MRWTASLVGLCGLLLASPPVSAEDAGIEVTANRKEIYLGESVILQVKASGSAAQGEPDLSAIPNCRVRLLGSQSASNYQITIINGRIQRQGFSGRIFTYEVTPQSAGDFTAGPVRVTASGQLYQDPGLRISVTGTEKQDFAIVEVSPSRDSVLLDEPFDITLTVHVRELGGRFSQVEPLDPTAPPHIDVPYLEARPIDGLKGPEVQPFLQSMLTSPERPSMTLNNYTVRQDPFDANNVFNFNMDDMFQEKPARFVLRHAPIDRDGVRYVAYRLTVTYQPSQEGNYTFGPVLLKGPIITGVDPEGHPVRRNVFAVGAAATVRVVPPPEQGQPTCFIGTMGTNLMVEATLDAQTCKVGDPLTLTLSVSGNVRTDKLVPPKLSLQADLTRDFTVYDDTVETVKKEGGRDYRFKLRPNRPGSIELPPIQVAYYDTSERGYRMVATRPLPLKVYRSEEFTGEQIIADTNRANELRNQAPLARLAIASLRADPQGAASESLIGDPRRLWIAGVGPLVFLFTWATRALAASFVRRVPVQRRRAAAKGAIAAMDRARKAAGRDPEQGRNAAFEALRAFVADRFDVPAAALTPDDARRLLAGVPVLAPHAGEFCRTMEWLFNAGYGTPAATAASVGEACERASAVLNALRSAEGNQV